MAVNQVSSNQSLVELMLKAKVQQGQKEEGGQAKQAETPVKQGQTNTGNEGVKVSVTAEGKAENRTVKANAPENTEQRTQEPKNAQTERAIQAYRNANAAAENGTQKPDNQKQGQMDRITG